MKKLNIIYLFLVVFFIAVAHAGTGDYLIGLKAYKDGLYDLAKSSLESFVKGKNDKKDVIFAKYILADIYIKEKDNKKALEVISELEGVSDERIDKKYLTVNKLNILVNKDCKKAESYLISHAENDYIKLFLSSKCPVTNNVIKLLKKDNISTNTKLLAFYKVSERVEKAGLVFNTMDIKKLEDKKLFELAIYFYNNKYYDVFWKIYSYKKNDVLVNLALQRLWDIKSSDSFLKNFESNVSKFDIAKINYCRAIKIYKDKNRSFDCNILKGCFKGSVENLVESTLSCLINKKDKNALFRYIDNNRESLKYICPKAIYIIEVNMYNERMLHTFSKCDDKNKYDIASFLVKKGLYRDIITLIGPPKSKKDYFYLAIAYKKLNNMQNYDKYKRNIKDDSLLKELNNL